MWHNQDDIDKIMENLKRLPTEFLDKLHFAISVEIQERNLNLEQTKSERTPVRLSVVKED